MPPPSPPPPVEPIPAGPAQGIQPKKSSWVNLFLIVGSVLVYIYSSFAENQEQLVQRLLPLFISLYPVSSPDSLTEVRHGEIWRLFTPAFIHFGVAHLGFNMLGLKNVGDLMERIHGSRFYLLLTAVLALASNLGQYYIYGSPDFGGMSGVLYGLFGYLWLRSLADPAYPLRLTRETVVVSMVWFAACFTGVLGPIANGAHTIGLVLGAAWGLVAARRAVARMRARMAAPYTGLV